MTRRCLGTAMLAGLALAVMSSTAAQVHATNSTLSGVTVQTLAQGPVKNLPPGKVCFNVLEFHQLPGAAYGPHDHAPLFVYTLHGIVTISYPGTAARSVGPGDAAFIPALVPAVTQDNVDGRIGAGALAVGLIVVVVLLCAATWLRDGRRRAITAVLLLLLIAGGALPLIGATSNDYYFIAARPGCAHPAAMPVPFGRVTFWSPDVDPRPAAPYLETLSEITVRPGARYDSLDVPGPEMFIVVAGSASVHVGRETKQLGRGDAAFVQAGKSLAILNSATNPLQLLRFVVT
jgi:quercetin dioxygenase-like cupin family protein